MRPVSFITISLALTASASASAAQRPCGLKIAPCARDQHCVPDSPDCSDLNRCRGTCQFVNKYASCGGKRVHPVVCAAGFECRDDPRLPPSCGLACDVPGICMPTKPRSCMGFAGFVCPKGLFCYDVPGDHCDPENGGADCLGLCL